MLNKIQERIKTEKKNPFRHTINNLRSYLDIPGRSNEHILAVKCWDTALAVPGLFIRNSDRFVYINERRYLNSRSKWVLKYMYLKVNISVNLII